MYLDLKASKPICIPDLPCFKPWNTDQEQKPLISECYLYQGDLYFLREAKGGGAVLVFEDLGVWAGKIIEVYSWSEIFHPMDIPLWNHLLKKFGLPLLAEWPWFSLDWARLQSGLDLLKPTQKRLIDQRKMDFRLPSFLKKNGLRPGSLIETILENIDLNYQAQMKVCEMLCRVLNRHSWTPEEFAAREDWPKMICSKSDLLQGLYQLCYPRLQEEIERKEKLLSGMKLQGLGRFDFDRSLEEPWIDLHFRLQNAKEWQALLDGLNHPDSSQAVQEVFDV